MAIYEKCGFTGTIIPDHTPRLDAADWWETGMAFALGYMRGIIPGCRHAFGVGDDAQAARAVRVV